MRACSRNQSHPPPKNPLPARTAVREKKVSAFVFQRLRGIPCHFERSGVEKFQFVCMAPEKMPPGGRQSQFSRRFSMWPEWMTGGFGSVVPQGTGFFSSCFIFHLQKDSKSVPCFRHAFSMTSTGGTIRNHFSFRNRGATFLR